MPVNEISIDSSSKRFRRKYLNKMNSCHYTQRSIQMGEAASLVEHVFPGGYFKFIHCLLKLQVQIQCLFKFILTEWLIIMQFFKYNIMISNKNTNKNLPKKHCTFSHVTSVCFAFLIKAAIQTNASAGGNLPGK